MITDRVYQDDLTNEIYENLPYNNNIPNVVRSWDNEYYSRGWG